MNEQSTPDDDFADARAERVGGKPKKKPKRKPDDVDATLTPDQQREIDRRLERVCGASRDRDA